MMSKGWLNRYLAKVEIFRVGVKHLRPDLSGKSRCLGANASPCQDLAQRVRSNNCQDLRPDLSGKSRCLGANASPCQDLAQRVRSNNCQDLPPDLSEKSRCLGASASPCQDFSKRANRLQKLVLDRVLFYLSHHGRAKDSDSLPWVSDKGYRPNPSPLQIKLLEMLLILASLTIGGAFTGKDNPALAQLIPDDTLGGESSVVNPIDNLNDRIDGGAIRGVNSFQSFLEFNVGEGRGVYFANPDGILNILTRVTGNNPSNIFGRLGVLGDANLFLINPNGIVFGKNASLDINGSFVATTANAISLGNNGYFSASEPGTSNLLSVNPGALFFNQVANQPGSIINHGNLGAGKDLTLAGSNLAIQGQLYAGRDLTLLGLNTLQVRDSVTHLFIAVAEGKLLLQGNQNVDIFALNHPDSGFYSGGDMVLRSGNTVGGDAHYWSGGSFRIEQLDGNLGDLNSPNDPIIRSRGDVSFNNYFGASLHIFAGGSVTIPGNVFITSPDPFDFIAEDITLSNGEVVSIDGSVRPTFDVRAGMNPADVGIPLGVTGINGFFINIDFTDIEPPVISNTATSADININGIVMYGAGAADGVVLLTNQYKPNSQLPGGDIEIGLIATDDTSAGLPGGGFFGNGGSIIIDSRSNINVTNPAVSASASGNAGDITLIASDIISLTNNAFISSATFGAGNGGSVYIQAQSLSLTDGAFITAITHGQGDGGNLTVKATDTVSLVNSRLGTQATNTGNSGNLSIKAEQVMIQNNLPDSIGVTANTFGEGRGGDLIVEAGQVIVRGQALVQAATFDRGKGGNLIIHTEQLILQQGAQVGTSTFGSGKSGDLLVTASDFVEVNGIASGLLAQVNPGAEGNGGNLSVNTPKLNVSDEAVVSVATYGVGNAGVLRIETGELFIQGGAEVKAGTFASGEGGSLIINASDLVQVIGRSADGQFASRLSTSTEPEATGKGGELIINTKQLLVQDGAQIGSGTFGVGDGGSLIVNASESVQLIGTSADSQFPSGLFTQAQGTGNARDLIITTPKLLVLNGAQVSASTNDSGNGGSLIVNASDSVQVIGRSADGQVASGLFASTEGRGKGGILIISTPQLVARNGALIQTATTETGEGGNLTIETRELIVQEGAQVGTSTFGKGQSGDLLVTASDFVELSGDDGGLFAQVNPRSEGDGGKLTVKTARLNVGDGAVVSTTTYGAGNAGVLRIETGELFIQGGAEVKASTFASGEGGSLIVNASDLVQVIGRSADGQSASRLSTSTEQEGTAKGGDLIINTRQLVVQDGAQVGSGTFGSGNGGILIVNASDSVQLIGTSGGDLFNSGLFTSTTGTGNAGELTITTPQLHIQDGAQISAATFNQGEGNKIQIDTNSLTLDNQSQITTRATGEGNAGPIFINVNGLLTATDSDISTNSTQSAGGAITITAENIRLFGDSDIKTNVSQGAGGGGNITIKADNIIAFDDSDILAFARDGKGGDITLDTDIFFGSSFAFAPKNTNPETLDINDRVDINASGAISGNITIPDVSFIENSLTELPDNLVDPDSLIANSCIARSTKQTGNFIITGSGGLPLRPEDPNLSPYPTGTVRNIPNDTPSTHNKPTDSWQIGDPIIEPQGVYQLPSGKLVMSRECSPSNP